jgi:hypothetical protein
MEYNFKEIDYDKILLDDKNPRLPKSYHGKSQKEILEYMLKDGSLIELMLAIATKGYFPGEQLLIVPLEGEIYKVIEGNRRLSAVLLLNEPNLISVSSKLSQVIEETKDLQKPFKIPCLEFKDEKDIHDYLGYRHITGIKEWKLLQKASYLHGLFNSNYEDSSIDDASIDLAKTIGSNRSYVKRLLVGYDMYLTIEERGFFNIPDLNEESFHFNYIADSLNRENIRSFLGVNLNIENPLNNFDVENLEKFLNWFFRKIYPKPEGYTNRHTKIIATSSSLTDLDTILGNEKSYEALVAQDKSIPEALKFSGTIEKAFSELISTALYNLVQADSIIINVSKFEIDFEDKLRDIISTSRKIKRYKEDIDDE